MDEVVMRAMARWPDVPAVYGWLSLDARGRWRLRGEPLEHRKAAAFIGRNYDCDDEGRWYFQNGPQRVFVSLEYTPWVLRLDAHGGLVTHTGHAVISPRAAFVDECGRLLLEFERGVGVVEDRDLEPLTRGLCDARGRPLTDDDAEGGIEALTAGRDPGIRVRVGDCLLPLTPLESARVAARFGYQPAPA